MRIGMIRHGETPWNAQSRLQGSTDIPLNERGIEQAQDAARLLRGHSWTRVVTSPLDRARHTGQIIAEALGIGKPEIVPDLVERSFGELEGELVYREDGTRMPLTHPSVESIEAVNARVFPALRDLAQRYPDEDVLAITHGSIVRLTLNVLLEWKAPHISNLALSVIETDTTAAAGFVARSANGYPIARGE